MGHSSQTITFICPGAVYMRSVWGRANNVVRVMFLEVHQLSAMLIKNGTISASQCRLCDWDSAKECVCYWPLYVFSSTFRTWVTCIQVFTSPVRLLYAAHNLQQRLYPFGLNREHNQWFFQIVLTHFITIPSLLYVRLCHKIWGLHSPTLRGT